MVNTLILLVGTITLLVSLVGLGWWFWGEHQTTDTETFNHLLRVCGIAWVLMVVVSMLGFITVTLFVKNKVTDTKPDTRPLLPVSEPYNYGDLGDRLHRRYGMFWRYKVRILLLLGEPEQVEAIAPGLTTQHWLEGHRTLLLWGGSLQTEPDTAQLAALRRLRRFRPLNGIVWALTEQQSAQPVWMDKALRMLQKQAQQLHWQAPIYLWQVCHSLWSQAGRVTQAVGCFLPERCTPEIVETHLQQLIDPMRKLGMQQVLAENAHDFLYRLSSTLEKQGIAHWRKVLTPWLAEYSERVLLRGLMFSLPLEPNRDAGPQNWLPDFAWQGVLTDSLHWHGRRFGWFQKRNVCRGLMVLALLWGAGSVLSLFTNRDQIKVVQAAVTDL
ncbi:type VI secretion protein VasK, partial [Photorhabdus tasmaniensis]|nr:type VI secretion protein VasK [Photorhabdus tasmaniensis]